MINTLNVITEQLNKTGRKTTTIEEDLFLTYENMKKEEVISLYDDGPRVNG